MNNSFYYPVAINDRNDIDDIPNFDICYITQSGLCNQLRRLINEVINGFNQNKFIFVIDSFLYCIQKGKLCNASNIFDYDEMARKMSDILEKEIIFVDRINAFTKILSVKYGLKSLKVIDITNNFKINDIKLSLSVDPLPNVKKYIYIKYIVGGHILNETYDENDIDANFDENYIKNIFMNKKFANLDTNHHNTELFNKLLTCISFNPKVMNIIDKISNTYIQSDIDCCIHLRIEDDAINHWSKINNLDQESFKNKLHEKYKCLINKYFYGNILVLCNDTNKISEFFINKQYHCIPQNLKEELSNIHLGLIGREINALIDLLTAIRNHCLFIGNYNNILSRGSTFSHVIMQYNKKNICIDLDNIESYEVIT